MEGHDKKAEDRTSFQKSLRLLSSSSFCKISIFPSKAESQAINCQIYNLLRHYHTTINSNYVTEVDISFPHAKFLNFEKHGMIWPYLSE